MLDISDPWNEKPSAPRERLISPNGDSDPLPNMTYDYGPGGRMWGMDTTYSPVNVVSTAPDRGAQGWEGSGTPTWEDAGLPLTRPEILARIVEMGQELERQGFPRQGFPRDVRWFVVPHSQMDAVRQAVVGGDVVTTSTALDHDTMYVMGANDAIS